MLLIAFLGSVADWETMNYTNVPMIHLHKCLFEMQCV